MSKFRRLSQAVLTGLLAIGPLVGANPANSMPVGLSRENDTLSARGEAAFAELTRCVAANGTLLVSIVVDDSGSLEETDPAPEQRPGAVAAVIDSLTALADTQTATGEPVHVEADFSVFGDGYQQLVGWQPIAGAAGTELKEFAYQRLRNSELDNQLRRWTDYRAALRGAEQAIIERASEVGGDPCTAIMWFTDGKLDLAGGPEVIEAARNEICEPGGIVDSIRRMGIHIISLALLSEAPDVRPEFQVTDLERRQLRAVSEYSDGEVTCGTDEGAAGAFLSAADTGEMWRRFAGVGALLQGANAGATGMSNEDGPIAFPVDEAIGRVRVLLQVADDGPVMLQLPDGSEIDLLANSNTNGVTVTVAGENGTYATTIGATTGLPAGIWTIPAAGVNAPTVVSDIYYFWDVTLDVTAPEGMELGRENPITISRHRGPNLDVPQDGNQSQWYADLNTEVTVNGKAVPVTRIQDNGDGTVSAVVDLTDSSSASTTAQIEALTNSITARSSLQLGPVSASRTFPVTLPAGYPSLAAPGSLSFGTFSAGSPGTASLQVVGSDQGPTSVCFGSAAFAEQPELAALQLQADSVDNNGCVELAPDESRNVNFSLDSAEPAQGAISGVVPVTVHPARGQAAETLNVPVTGRIYRPVDAGILWRTVALLWAAAALIWWGVAWFARHRSDRFAFGTDLRAAEIPVTLTNSGITRDGYVSPDQGLLDRDDFRQTPLPASKHRPVLSPLQFDRQGSQLNPLQPYRPVVSAPGAIVTNVAKLNDGDARDTPANFSLAEDAYLVVPPTLVGTDEPISGTLHVFVEGTDGSIAEAVAQASKKLAPATGFGGTDWSRVNAEVRERLQSTSPVEAVLEERASAGRGIKRRAKDDATDVDFNVPSIDVSTASVATGEHGLSIADGDPVSLGADAPLPDLLGGGSATWEVAPTAQPSAPEAAERSGRGIRLPKRRGKTSSPTPPEPGAGPDPFDDLPDLLA